MNGFEKDNDYIIQFVNSCYISGVVKNEEIEEWIYLIIDTNNHYPTYLLDILDQISKNEQFINITPSWFYTGGGGDENGRFSEEELDALNGIYFLRGFYDGSYDLTITEDKAIELLKKNPRVERMFRKTFPFIKWDGFLTEEDL